MHSLLDVKAWVSSHTRPGFDIRPYQIEAWKALWDARANGKARALLCLATGLGKTSVAAVDVLKFVEDNATAHVLFVSHMSDISHQAQKSFQHINPQMTTQYWSSLRRKRKDVSVMFTTFQALYANLDSFAPDSFDYIIYDEAHHTEAKTFKAVREHFRPQFQLGLTATPERADEQDIERWFGAPTYQKTLTEGIIDGWLAALDYHIVFDETVKRAMAEGFEDKNIGEIQQLLNVYVRNDIIAKNIIEERSRIGMDKAKTILFCNSLAHAEEMAVLVGGEAYHSQLAPSERERILNTFRSKEGQIICTVNMFNEGIDIPDARLVVFLRTTNSKTIFEQQLGRGLRRTPGKTVVTILDFVANVERIINVQQLGHELENAQRDTSGRFTGGEESDSAGEQQQRTEKPGMVIPSHFEFDRLAVGLINKYNSVKQAPPAPEGYVRYTHAWGQLGISKQALARLVNKLQVGNRYRWPDYGRPVIAFSPEEMKVLRANRHTYDKASSEGIAEAYKELKNHEAVGRLFGITGGAVAKRLKKMGLYQKKIGMTPRETCRFCGMLQIAKTKGAKTPVCTGSPTGRHRYAPGTSGDRTVGTEEIVKAYGSAGTLRGAAKMLGISHKTVHAQLIQSGYKLREVNHKPSQEAKKLIEQVKRAPVGDAAVYQSDLEETKLIQNLLYKYSKQNNIKIRSKTQLQDDGTAKLTIRRKA